MKNSKNPGASKPVSFTCVAADGTTTQHKGTHQSLGRGAGSLLNTFAAEVARRTGQSVPGADIGQQQQTQQQTQQAAADQAAEAAAAAAGRNAEE